MLSGRLAVITPTCALQGRNRMLVSVLQAIKDQNAHPFHVDHVVVADGPAARAGHLARHHGAEYLQLSAITKTFGTLTRSQGCSHMLRKTVAPDWFWFCDDDITVLPTALATFATAPAGTDLVVARIEHWRMGATAPVLIPRKLAIESPIDTACLFVSRKLAANVSWASCTTRRETDQWYYRALLALKPSVAFVGGVVALHIPGRSDGDPN